MGVGWSCGEFHCPEKGASAAVGSGGELRDEAVPNGRVSSTFVRSERGGIVAPSNARSLSLGLSRSFASPSPLASERKERDRRDGVAE